MRFNKIPAVILGACLGASGCGETASSTTLNQDRAVEQASNGTLPHDSDSRARGGSHSTAQMPVEELLSLHSSSLLALSAEEAAWLDRNGYPTIDELAAIHTLDADALDDAARNRKDKKSAVLLGHRLVAEGDITGALASFSHGARLGSLYAQQQFALYSAQRSSRLPVDELDEASQGVLGAMIARLEVARLLGDHRAQALIDRYGAGFSWDRYGQQLISQVAILMDQYGRDARSRGTRAKGPDPRPNADAWAKLTDDQSGLVMVYTRGGTSP